MPMTKTTRRRRRIVRLTIVISAFIILVGGVYGLFLLNSSRQTVSAEDLIEEAQAAFEIDDFDRVVRLLERPGNPGSTIAAIRDKPELLKIYVHAWENQTPSAGQYLENLVAPLRQIIKLDQDDADHSHKLLELLLLLQRDRDAVELAEQLTQRFPQDAEAFRKLASALYRSNQPEASLQALLKSTQIEPLHVQAYAGIVDLIGQDEAQLAAFIERAEAIYQSYPEDPRALMIRALAYHAEENTAQATAMLQQAARHAPPNEALVPVLVRWLDRSGLFVLASEYLDRHAEPGIETPASQQAIFRAFEAGDYPSTIARLADADPGQANTDLLGVWATAYVQTGDTNNATKYIEALEQRDSPIAQVWSRLLRLDLADATPPGAIIDTIVASLDPDKDPYSADLISQHPYLMQRLGEAYVQAHEPYNALRRLSTAARNSNSWARPQRELAELLLSLGNPQQAYLLAREAALREPSPEAEQLLLRAVIASVDPSDAKVLGRVIDQADNLLNQTDANKQILPALIDLLARAGRGTLAKERIDQLLQTGQPVAADTLTALLQQSYEHDLGLEDAISNAIIERHGMTPGLAVLQAQAKADAGDPESGRQLIEQSMPSPPTKPWQIALMGYLVENPAADATGYRAGLADQYPDDLALQLSALGDPNILADTGFARRAIDRVKAQAGESSINWRLATARLNMLVEPSDASFQHAVTLLRGAEKQAPENLQIQLLLTRCHLWLGDDKAAIVSAERAKRISPQHTETMFLHGKALHRLKRFQESRIDLITVARRPQADPALRQQACVMLENQGERSVAREVLQSMWNRGIADRQALILLAKLFAAESDYPSADRVCESLLKNPDAVAISFVASYYRWTNRPEWAEELLQAAESAPISEADRLMLNAEDAARRGQAQAAIASIQSAAELEPQNLHRWHAAVQMALSLGLAEHAQRLAKLGLTEVPDDPGLTHVMQHQDLIRIISSDKAAIPLAITLLLNPAHRDQAVTTLRLLNRGGGVDELLSLAQQSPDFKHLHVIAADRLLQAGQNERAYQLASSVMSRFPDSAAAARISALAAYRMTNWTLAQSAAKAWADRNPLDRANADLVQANAHAKLDRFGVAKTMLKPYIAAQTELDSDTQPFFDLYTQALVHTGETDAAWNLLRPQLDSSPEARSLVIKRAAQDLAQADTATRWLGEAESASPATSENLFAIATAMYIAGERLKHTALIESAGRLITRLLAQPGEHSIDVFYVQGQIAQRLGDLELAQASYRKVLDVAPSNPQLLNNLAMTLAELGGASLTEAEQLAERATGLAKNDPNLFDTLAFVRLKRGKVDSALEAIEKSIRLDPGNYAWQLTLADILEARGDAERAELIRSRNR